ncbi:MAG: diguanylate cyclase [Burkholderiales bacterium]|nr:diguanylate cyclase [Burkholderiales bacterium]
MPSATASSQAEFKLLRYFASASLVAFVVAAILLGYVFRAQSIGGLLAVYEGEHVNHAQIIANQMWERNFGPLILARLGKSDTELKVLPQMPALHQEVLALLKGTQIFKIKVYDLKGITVYSTELRQIGEDKSKNAGVIDGLRGLKSSELVHRNQFSAFEGEVQQRDLVESYIPRYDPVSGKVSGVFEIYGDATEMLAEIGKRQWILVLAVMTLLSLLYLALSTIVKRAQDHIAEQNRARQKAQQDLALSEERWKFALEGADAGVWDRNLQAGEVVYSKGYSEIYGFGENETVDPNWEDRVHPDDLPLVQAEREAYFTGKTQSYASERRMRCRDGTWKWILSRGMVVARDAQGRPSRMIGTHTDISERKAAQASMQTMAHFDSLTGLPNRVLFLDRLRQAVAKARRDAKGMALMMVDLDEFKPVNDEYGHQVGDLLLKEVAGRMLECVRRETDTVARLGGDEFVVILPEIEKAQDAIAVAENIRQALNRDFQIGERLITISSCTGVAIFPEHGADETALLKSADAAMYRAKEEGRNRVQLAPVATIGA